MIAIGEKAVLIYSLWLSSCSLGILWYVYNTPVWETCLAPCDWAPLMGRPKIGRPMPPHRQLS
jgi:hypothetical protein